MPAHTVTALVSAAAGLLGTAIVIPAVLLGGGPSDAAAAGAAQQAALSGGACSYAPADDGGGTATGIVLDASQLDIARTAVGVAQQRQLPAQASIDVLAAGYQESRLTNLSSGDRDSVGFLQQRPSQGWGTVAQLEDPTFAAGAFFDRLLTVDAWQQMPPAQAIQDVQVSSDGSLYAQWIPLATALAASLLGDPSIALSCSGGGGSDPPGQAPNAVVGTVLGRARAQLGLPYCFAGGTSTGPSHGQGGPGCGGQIVGFDCSGLALFAWAGGGVSLPHLASAQYTSPAGVHVPVTSIAPGDLVFLSSDGTVAGIHHVAIIWSVTGKPDGSGQIIEAQDYGVPVHIRTWRGTGEAEVMPLALRLTPH
jgi:cell wall-associated NlpC family hydrolase